MKATHRFALLVLGALLPTLSHADLIATEYFNDYGKVEIVSDGTNLNGGTGWTSAWLFSDEKYLPSSSISYTATGYNSSANFSGIGVGAMAYSGNGPGGSTATRSFTTSSTTVWFSALISIDETWDRALLWIDSTEASAGDTGNDFIGVLDGAIQMRYNNTNFTTAGAPAVGKHLLLAKAEIDVSGANDRLSFWFDPDLSSGEAGLGTPTYTDDTADTFGTSIDGIGVLLINRDEDGLGGYITDTDTEVENGELIDAILVGTTFVDVIPQLSQSEVIATEYFNGYGTSEIVSDGANLTGGSGWSSAWLWADESYIPATSLSYTATGYDNSANLSGPGDGAMAYAGNLALPSVSTATRALITPATTVWFSALISIDETWDRAILWIDSVGGSAGNDFVGVLDNAIQMRYNNINFTTAGPPTVGTHLLLAKAEIDVSGTNDRLSFWFNPDLSGGEGGLGTPTYTDDTADTFGTTIDGIGVLLVNRDENGMGGYITDADTEVENGELIDAIRVGTTLDSVISNPPAMPQVTSITKTGATVTVEFTGAEGVSYGLNKSVNLDFTTPNIVATTAVSGGTGTLEDTSANTDAAFYRVESQD